MKAFNLLIICLTMMSPVYGQEIVSSEYNFEINPADTLIINLRGAISIKNHEENRTKIIATVEKKGRVYGYSNLKSRKAYKLDVSRNANHVTIKPEKRENFRLIGLNTYREKKSHTIYVPEFANIVIRASNTKITSSGNFKNLTINNREGSSELVVSNASLQFFAGYTKNGKILRNGIKQDDKAIAISGSGTSFIKVNSKDGNILVKLIK